MDSYYGDLGPDSTVGAQNLSIAVGVRNDDGEAVDAPTAGSRSSSIRERSETTFDQRAQRVWRPVVVISRTAPAVSLRDAPTSCAMVVVVMVSMVASLDSTVSNLALAATEHDLGGGLALQQWIIDPGLVLAEIGLLLIRPKPNEFHAITDLVPGMTVLAIGLVVTITPLTSLTLASGPTEHSGPASAINNGVSRLAALMSIGSMGLITAGTVSAAGFAHVLEVSAGINSAATAFG